MGKSKNRRLNAAESMRINGKQLSYKQILFKECNGICPECKKPMSLKNPKADNYATIDHILPKSLGGINIFSNYNLLCKKCNQEKGSKFGDKEKEILKNRKKKQIHVIQKL